MDILIAPQDVRKLTKVTLPRPKDESPQHFLYDEENLSLYEIIEYKDEYRSWFIDNRLCSDGHFKMLTKIDPLFVFVSQVIKFARNQFRPIADICLEYDQSVKSSAAKTSKVAVKSSGDQSNPVPKLDKLDYALAPNIKWENICDSKEIDGELFVRFSETRTIDWLLKKHARLMGTLTGELDDTASKATVISYALDLIDDYVHHSLSFKFKEAIRNRNYGGSSMNTTCSAPNKSCEPQIHTKMTKNPAPKRSAPVPTTQGNNIKQKPAASGIEKFFKKK